MENFLEIVVIVLSFVCAGFFLLEMIEKNKNDKENIKK